MAASRLSTSILDAVCADCNTCFDRGDEECPDCGRPRPSDGWPSLRDSPYPFLGRIVDDRYLIDQFVDSGASGHVYRARGLSFKRHFALKIIDARRFDDPEIRQEVVTRFQQEVDTISQIRNPHVIDVYEAIELDENIYGLIMNFVEGQTLNKLLDQQGRLSVEQALSIASQIANGVHEAHRRGIIHRDLKPENVIIETLPASGLFARVLDFGIAHDDQSDKGGFGFQGTPLYASPEQCTEEAPPTAASDIYSLGCLLYHLLTGEPPFAYTNALRVMDAHVNDPRPRLSDGGDRDFPEDLEYLVGHMMARDPDDRPESLFLVYEDLKALKKGAPLRHLKNTPANFSDDVPSAQPLPQPPTPPAGSVVSLSEWTSSELADDPTLSEATEAPWKSKSGGVHMNLLRETDTPYGEVAPPKITAAAIDKRGLACLFADPNPTIHLVGLGKAAFHNSFDAPAVVSAADLDLHAGYLLAATVEGHLDEYDPGSGQRRGSHNIECSPLAMVFLSTERKVYLGTERGELHRFDLRTGSRHELLRFPEAIATLASGHGATLLVGLWDGSLALVDGDEQVKWHLPIAPDAVADVGVIDEERYFAIDGRGTLHIGTLQGGATSSSLEVGPGLRSVRRLDDGRIVAVSIFGQTIQFWELEIAG